MPLGPASTAPPDRPGHPGHERPPDPGGGPDGLERDVDHLEVGPQPRALMGLLVRRPRDVGGQAPEPGVHPCGWHGSRPDGEVSPEADPLGVGRRSRRSATGAVASDATGAAPIRPPASRPVAGPIGGDPPTPPGSPASSGPGSVLGHVPGGMVGGGKEAQLGPPMARTVGPRPLERRIRRARTGSRRGAAAYRRAGPLARRRGSSRHRPSRRR